ncbi:DUF4238 domain-containing protein [Halorubrum distributum]|uniref:DUF4238 domain-containing protein n=1 Tax=Halorubrum distributum TaxID=29283 RepID=UPI0009B5BE5A|nr:DUF4238 domain-containing protein [Halorubrum terrestre]
MVNEHIVPQAYLQNFSPDGKGLISRYSLLDKHGGGGYHSPRDRYSIKKAASYEDFAGGFLENDETNNAEKEMIRTIRSILNGKVLTAKDVPGVSTFISFQTTRSINSRLYFTAKERLPFEEFNKGIQDWLSAVSYNTSEGHTLLQYMGWVLIKNKTNLPFFTSDEPVVEVQGENVEKPKETSNKMVGRQIFCPIGPNHLLLLLDPSAYDVEGLLHQVEPEDGIENVPDEIFYRFEVDDPDEIWKINLLQPLSAYREVFAPVNNGEMLEKSVDVLCSAFPDDDYIRGNSPDLGKMFKAYAIAASGPESQAEREWYQREGFNIMKSRKKKVKALGEFSHSISLTTDLAVASPDYDYWSSIVEVLDEVPTDSYIDADDL